MTAHRPRTTAAQSPTRRAGRRRTAFDPAAVPNLARLADRACDGIEEMHDAGMQVEDLAKQADPPLDPVAAQALFTTIMYLIEVASPGDPPDARLGPVDDWSLFPVAFRDAGEDLYQLWLALASEVVHPVARASAGTSCSRRA